MTEAGRVTDILDTSYNPQGMDGYILIAEDIADLVSLFQRNSNGKFLI